MIKFIATLLCVGIVDAVEVGGFSYNQRQIHEIENALASYEKLAEQASISPSKDLIPQLGTGLRKTARPEIYVVGDRIGVHKRLQQALLSIPGHAEFYRDDFNAARQKVEEAKSKGNVGEREYYRTDLANKANYDFQTLGHLPSVETVRILGEFLYDERGYVKMPDQPTLGDLTRDIADSPIFRNAAIALLKLPLLNKPVAATEYPQYQTPEDVKPWRQWYEEIKSGKRTFRFEGDPTEYDLNGPAPKEKLERIALNRRMESDREARHGKAGVPEDVAKSEPQRDAPSMVLTIVLNLAGLAALATAVWYFAKVRSRWSH